MSREITLTAEEAAESDAISIDEKAVKATAESLSEALMGQHRAFLQRQSKYWRGLYVKYNLNADMDYHVSTGPGGGSLIEIPKMPQQAAK